LHAARGRFRRGTRGSQHPILLYCNREPAHLHGERLGDHQPADRDHGERALKLLRKYPTGKGSNWVEIVGFD
jgi:hypothetical protein